MKIYLLVAIFFSCFAAKAGILEINRSAEAIIPAVYLSSSSMRPQAHQDYKTKINNLYYLTLVAFIAEVALQICY